jgi:alkylation response protein AidB-like acyl-CoA dehydrogenase
MNINAPIASDEAAGDPVARARALRPQIEAAAAAIEQERAIPRELLALLHEARLFRLLLPKSCGGEEVAPAVYVAAVEEVAKADASVAWCMSQGSGCSMAAAYLDPAIARENFGPRDAVLAWGPAAANGKATEVGGGFRVSGIWPYASGSRHAQWLGGHAQIVDAEGKPCLGADGKPMERSFLFPKAKAAIKDTWHVVGLKGTGSDTYTVADLLVPERYSFRREFTEDRRETGPLYRLTSFQLYGCGFAAVALGIARATLDALIAMAAAKIPAAGVRPLRESAVVQAKVASAEARWQSARAYLMQAIDDAWESVSSGESATLTQRAAMRLAGVYATQQAREVVESAYHLAGGSAIFEGQAFERRLRDMHTVTQQAQGQLVNFEHVGQVLLGLPNVSRLI